MCLFKRYVRRSLAGKSQAEGTAEQRWACEQDAFKFCGTENSQRAADHRMHGQDVKKLSPACRAQFK